MVIISIEVDDKGSNSSSHLGHKHVIAGSQMSYIHEIHRITFQTPKRSFALLSPPSLHFFLLSFSSFFSLSVPFLSLICMYNQEPPPQYSDQPIHRFDNVRSAFQNFSLDHRPHLHRSSTSKGEIIAGPLLRYIGTNYERNTYIGSCLVVSTHKRAPSIEVTVRPASATPGSSKHHHFRRNLNTTRTYRLAGEPLDVFGEGYTFWRYAIELPLTHEPQIATYTSDTFAVTPAIAQHQQQPSGFDFHLPSLQQSMRFMFYSCNGFSDIPQEMKDKFGEKEAPLWQDVLDRHQIMPFHVLLGGGDQLYQDRLLKEDFMKPWRDEKDPKKRVGMTLTKAMRDGFEHFYFWNYVINFG